MLKLRRDFDGSHCPFWMKLSGQQQLFEPVDSQRQGDIRFGRVHPQEIGTRFPLCYALLWFSTRQFLPIYLWALLLRFGQALVSECIPED